MANLVNYKQYAKMFSPIFTAFKIIFIINWIANYYVAIIYKIIATRTNYNGGCGMMAIQIFKTATMHI